MGLFLRVGNGQGMTGERPKAFVVPRAGAVPTGRADHRARPNADRPLQRTRPGRAGRVAAQYVAWQYPQGRAARGRVVRSPQPGSGLSARAQASLQTGARFSRNAAMPSAASGVWLVAAITSTA